MKTAIWSERAAQEYGCTLVEIVAGLDAGARNLLAECVVQIPPEMSPEDVRGWGETVAEVIFPHLAGKADSLGKPE